MKTNAQDNLEIEVDDLDSTLDLTVDDALQLALTEAGQDKLLDQETYEKILSKLGEIEQEAFTMGIASQGIQVKSEISVVVEADMNNLDKIKNAFIRLYNKQGCVYEDDYNNITASLDAKNVPAVFDWFMQTGIPLKKNLPSFDRKRKKTKYQEGVKEIVKNPDVKKVKGNTLHRISQYLTGTELEETAENCKELGRKERSKGKGRGLGLGKGKGPRGLPIKEKEGLIDSKASTNLNKVIKKLRRCESDFLPAWTQWDKSKRAQNDISLSEQLSPTQQDYEDLMDLLMLYDAYLPEGSMLTNKIKGRKDKYITAGELKSIKGVLEDIVANKYKQENDVYYSQDVAMAKDWLPTINKLLTKQADVNPNVPVNLPDRSGGFTREEFMYILQDYVYPTEDIYDSLEEEKLNFKDLKPVKETLTRMLNVDDEEDQALAEAWLPVVDKLLKKKIFVIDKTEDFEETAVSTEEVSRIFNNNEELHSSALELGEQHDNAAWLGDELEDLARSDSTFEGLDLNEVDWKEVALDVFEWVERELYMGPRTSYDLKTRGQIRYTNLDRKKEELIRNIETVMDPKEAQNWIQMVNDSDSWNELHKLWRLLFGGQERQRTREQRWQDVIPADYGMLELPATKKHVECSSSKKNAAKNSRYLRLDNQELNALGWVAYHVDPRLTDIAHSFNSQGVVEVPLDQVRMVKQILSKQLKQERPNHAHYTKDVLKRLINKFNTLSMRAKKKAKKLEDLSEDVLYKIDKMKKGHKVSMSSQEMDELIEIDDGLLDYISSRPHPNKVSLEDKWLVWLKDYPKDIQSSKTEASLTNRISKSPLCSVYRDSTSGGWIAEVRGLMDQDTGIHNWYILDVYGTREAAEHAVAKAMGWNIKTEASQNPSIQASFNNRKGFSLYVADTQEKLTAGLETFEELKDNEGMLFPYGDPTHVTFHMGKVKFPIDIVFLQEDDIMGLKVAKIVHNAKPGALEHWGSYNTVGVIELNGGVCKANDIKLGSKCELYQKG